MDVRQLDPEDYVPLFNKIDKGIGYLWVRKDFHYDHHRWWATIDSVTWSASFRGGNPLNHLDNWKQVHGLEGMEFKTTGDDFLSWVSLEYYPNGKDMTGFYKNPRFDASIGILDSPRTVPVELSDQLLQIVNRWVLRYKNTGTRLFL